jgi:long-chain acyl-CoA synthetase
VLQLGENNPEVELGNPTADSVCMFVFTSGSTGNPKGVEITHKMVVLSFLSANPVFPVHPDSATLNYAPLPNIGGILTYTWAMFPGAATGFYSGDNLKIFDDAQVLKPVQFAGAPKVWAGIHDKVWAGVATQSPLK